MPFVPKDLLARGQAEDGEVHDRLAAEDEAGGHGQDDVGRARCVVGEERSPRTHATKHANSLR